jgi:hypothetical protein
MSRDRFGRQFPPMIRLTPISGWSLALIGNASGQTLGWSGDLDPRRFSIRRLGGSRWRLRRTRCAMGFERQLAAQSRVGQLRVNGRGRVAMVDSAACGCRSVRKQWRGRLSAWGRHTNASLCRSTSQEQWRGTCYEESK